MLNVNNPNSKIRFPLDGFTKDSIILSLRLLVKSHINRPLITVRRSSDNEEHHIGANRFGYLDVRRLLAFAGSDSVYITTIYNQARELYNAVQTTAGYQPLIVNAGALVTDSYGRPTMRFDGTDDNLIITDPTFLNTETIGVNATYKLNALSFFGRIIHRGNDSGYGFCLRESDELGKVMFLSNRISSTDNVKFDAAFTTSDWQTTTGICNGSAQSIYKTTTLQSATLTSVAIVGSTSDIYIGTRAGGVLSPCSMDLSEVVIYKIMPTSLSEKLAKNQRRYYKIA